MSLNTFKSNKAITMNIFLNCISNILFIYSFTYLIISLKRELSFLYMYLHSLFKKRVI